MRPVVNVPEENRATDTRNMQTKFGKDRACGSGDILAKRQTVILITILRNRSSGEVTITTRMWANAQRDGRPAEYRWRPLFNAAKFG